MFSWTSLPWIHGWRSVSSASSRACVAAITTPALQMTTAPRKLDRSAGLDCHDIEAEFRQPVLDVGCARGISEHPGG